MDYKSVLNRARLYVLLDKGLLGNRNLEGVAFLLAKGGAQIIQYRDKASDDRRYLENSQAVQKVTKKWRIPLILNDRLDVAWCIGAEGVHLGRRDLPVKVARKLLGKKAIIGSSAETLAQALEAQKKGADYVGVGPIFHTATKKIERVRGTRLLRSVKGRLRIPYFAIGGINLKNIDQVLKAGCNQVVVGSAILNSKDIKSTCRDFLKKLRPS